MGLFSTIMGAVGVVAKPVTTWLEGRNARKQAQLQSELAISEAKTQATIKRLETGQKADIAWENLSIEKAGWKDEFWTVVLSIPAILCFIPGGDRYVKAGFEALQNTPDWYAYALGLAIASSFGYRKFTDFMARKKGE